MNLIIYNFSLDLIEQLKSFLKSSFEKDCILKHEGRLIYDDQCIEMILNEINLVVNGENTLKSIRFESSKIQFNLIVASINFTLSESILREIRKD
jgi:hypothetical protein